MGEKGELLITLLLGNSNYGLFLSDVYALLFNYFCMSYLTFPASFAQIYLQ